MKERNIIFIEGLGFSGSGALLDLLREVDQCFVLPTEFRLINDPDGLLSLESAIIDNWTVFQSDIAIKRFRKLCKNLTNKNKGPYTNLDHTKFFGKDFMKMVDEYLDLLTQLKFRGLWYGIDTFLKRKLIGRKLIGRNRFTTRPMYVAKNIDRSEFHKLTHDFITKLASLCIKQDAKEFFVIDGDFAVLNAQRVLNYFPKGKMILVIRDPRDILATVRNGLGNFMPDNFKDNLEWQLAIYRRWKKSLETTSKNQVMVVYFEDLVKNYDQQIREIFSFLNIDQSLHNKQKEVFDPKVSIKNIGLWKHLLSSEEAKLIEQKFEGLYDRFN
jgi:hypothetical protein